MVLKGKEISEKKRENRTLFSSFPKGPGCCHVCDPRARFAYHLLAGLELMSPVIRVKAILAPSAAPFVVQLWTLPLQAALSNPVHSAQFCFYSAKL